LRRSGTTCLHTRRFPKQLASDVPRRSATTISHSRRHSVVTGTTRRTPPPIPCSHRSCRSRA
jgi:hypothetical protein